MRRPSRKELIARLEAAERTKARLQAEKTKMFERKELACQWGGEMRDAMEAAQEERDEALEDLRLMQARLTRIEAAKNMPSCVHCRKNEPNK
jgi:hypothetical protein